MAELLLSAQNITKFLGDRLLFDDLSLFIHEREHVGVIGPNGVGKSTFLKILAGLEEQDEGHITTRKGLRLCYVPQVETFNPEHTVLEAAEEALRETYHEEIERQTHAAVALSKIGFEDLSQKVSDLSGGWKKRLSIARQIAKEPDLMLLDEPTNHMDLEGIEWLENYLKSAHFSFMVISHDRRFLDSAINRTLEINHVFPNTSFSSDVAYSEFLERRTTFLEQEAARYESMKNKARNEQEWLRAGVQGRGTKQNARQTSARQLLDAVSEMKGRQSINKKVRLEFEQTDRKTKRLAVLHKVSKSFGEKSLFSKIELTLSPKSRLGLLGYNGCGKSTLMKIIAGDLKADEGKVTYAPDIRILSFHQDRKLLNPKATLKESLTLNGGDSVHYKGGLVHVASFASMLKFRSDQLDTPICKLSGGEQARVLIGQLMQQPADILLLDEPTNDLDIPSLEVLEESLESFPGAVVLVTHDREMLDRISTQLIGFDGQGGAEFYADYDQWKKHMEKKSAETVLEAPKQVTKVKEVPKPKPKKVKLSYKEQREFDMMEEAILQAETTLEEVEASPADMADGQAYQAWCEALSSAQLKVEELYARWTELEEKQQG